MAIDIDGLAVLQAIAATPQLFPDAAPEINSFARKYVAGQLKPATINLQRLRDIYRAIGSDAFVLILDGQTDSASAALVKKLDKDHPELKTALPDWLRRRIVELATGVSEPARKPSKPAPKEKAIAAALKAKTINLEKARALWLEAGVTSFTLVLSGLTDNLTLTLAKRLDKDDPDLKTAPPDRLRQRIADLASGAAEPVFVNILDSKAMSATRTKTRKRKPK